MEKGEFSHESLLQLEHPFLKVPFEQLNKAFRSSQKLIEKEMQNLTNTITESLEKATTGTMDQNEALKLIDNLIQRIQNAKKRFTECQKEESQALERSEMRLVHLEEMMKIETVESDAYQRWNETRVDRILIDYMLREGFYETASTLARENQITELVDIDLFINSKKVEKALKNGSCAECLQWCNDNKSKLKKLESTLEFNLRLQEYIELIKQNRLHDAISYSRKHFPPWVDTHMKEIQKAMVLLAFPYHRPNNKFYVEYYSPKRWEQLIEQFRNDNFKLYSLTNQPLLSMTLQAGLSALKTPMCYMDENKNLNCPVCNFQMGELGRALPYSHHNNSTIVCRISGEIMNENNLPMVLPNGYVYSTKSLEEMALQNKGYVICPRTNERFKFAELRKVYIT